ncbi:MAG: PIG-L family deacetylase [Anaerolineae bacterium]
MNQQQQSLLLCLAHPDDESFGSGGMMATVAARGVEVTLVCATRGEVGEISDPALATPETLAQVREAELRCACETLGVNPPIFLGYRDSGMAGTEENQHPAAFANAPAGAVVPRLVGLIRRLRPQVVITFDPSGGYGHPDHIAIHHHTVAAFHAAGDAAQYPAQGEPWQPARLLYAVLPKSLFERMRQMMVEAGVDTSDWDRFAEEGDIGFPDEEIQIVVDVSGTVEAKWAALHCHATQFGQDNTFRKVSEADSKQMMSREYFVQAWPEPAPGLRLDDIFAGLS